MIINSYEVTVRYSLEQYDKHGFLKAPLWLWLGWLFLAKAWVIFILLVQAGKMALKFLILFTLTMLCFI